MSRFLKGIRTNLDVRWLTIVTAVFLCIGVFLYGSSVLHNNFVEWDDFNLIVGNPAILDFGPSSIKHFFTSYDPELYVPVTMISLAIDAILFGMRAVGFHATNLALHIVNAVLMVWFLHLLTGKKWISAGIGLLFLAHPLNVEAVAWASARKDLLSAFFSLLTMIQFLRERNRGQKRHIASTILFILACLSKVSAIAVLPALVMIDWYKGVPKKHFHAKNYGPFFIVGGITAIIAIMGRFTGIFHLVETLLLSPLSLVTTMRNFVLPLWLSVLYPFTGPVTLSNPVILVSLIIVLAAAILACIFRNRYRGEFFAAALFVLFLVPNIANFRRGEDFGDIYVTSDRYAYVAQLGLFLLGAFYLQRITARLSKKSQAWVLGMFTAALFILSVPLTFVQAKVWGSTETLFSNVLDHYPNAQTAHVILAGKAVEKQDYADAFGHYEAALSIRPTARAYYNMGAMLLESGQYNDSIAAFRKALELDATSSLATLNIGAAFMEMKEYEQAKAAFEYTLRIDPKAVAAEANLGLALERLGRTSEAIQLYEDLLRRHSEIQGLKERLQNLKAQQK